MSRERNQEEARRAVQVPAHPQSWEDQTPEPEPSFLSRPLNTDLSRLAATPPPMVPAASTLAKKVDKRDGPEIGVIAPAFTLMT